MTEKGELLHYLVCVKQGGVDVSRQVRLFCFLSKILVKMSFYFFFTLYMQFIVGMHCFIAKTFKQESCEVVLYSTKQGDTATSVAAVQI